MRTTVFATFIEAEPARKAMGALLDHGAKVEDISLILPENYRDTYDDTMETEEGAKPQAEETKHSAETGITTTTGADAADGALKGTGVGFGIGAIAAIVSILVPGIGLIVGGGALATALAGAAATTAAGAIAGGVTGYLKDQGVPEGIAAQAQNVHEKGGAILSLSVPSGPVDATTAETVLAKYGFTNLEVWRDDPAYAGATPPPIP
jgi:hypothetical protein